MKLVRVDVKVEEVPGQLSPQRLRAVLDGRLDDIRAINGVVSATVTVLDPRDDEAQS